MPARYYTPEEADDLLPAISDLLGQLLERRARVMRVRQENQELFSRQQHENIGGGIASQLPHEFAAIEQLLADIRGYGCEIKDLNGGLIDFLAKKENGREVYLCWRYGESLEIRYYHELHAGFNGRREISAADRFVSTDFND